MVKLSFCEKGTIRLTLRRSREFRRNDSFPTASGAEQISPKGDCRGSDVRLMNNAPVAQLAEQLTLNQLVGGSIPPWRTALDCSFWLNGAEKGFRINLARTF